MKKILTIIIISTITACSKNTSHHIIENREEYKTYYKNKHLSDKVDTLSYFIDAKTGICFAKQFSITSYDYGVTSITCVPCDSLKNVYVDTLNSSTILKPLTKNPTPLTVQ